MAHPPNAGIAITHQQAASLLRNHLDRALTAFAPLDRGFNNRLYLIDDEQGGTHVLK
ncbi:hypothetical protein HK101_007108, partial [Irineochytrium annulatum]